MPTRFFIKHCSTILYTLIISCSAGPSSAESIELVKVDWPEGSQVLPFDDVEGAVLVQATLGFPSVRDTSGPMLLDTGAGYLAVDLELSRVLGLSDSAAPVAAVGMADRPLPRLQLGGLQVDQVQPVLTIDAGIVRRVTGRPVLGLLGQSLLRDRVVILDYASGTLVLLPPGPDSSATQAAIGAALSPMAEAVPFRLVGDGKAVLRVRVGGVDGTPPTELSLILDTGATKTVLFRRALDRRLPGWVSWPSIRGLGAPTLTGVARARVVRVPSVDPGRGRGAVSRSGVDAAVIDGDLPGALESALGEPVDGLLGYSFLKHFRVALDYPRRLLWLDPSQGGVPDRASEYCHPGIQLEDALGSLRVTAVADGSPAARAGIRPGDELLAVDGSPVAGSEVVEVGRRLEGDPGTRVELRLRRGSRTWSKSVRRTPLF
jgi:predicted aspartyl protease